MQDPNRTVATLAITTLLKTGAEAQVEPLMKQISSFVPDVADDFKVCTQSVRLFFVGISSCLLFYVVYFGLFLHDLI